MKWKIYICIEIIERIKSIILHIDLPDVEKKVLWAMIAIVKCYVLDGLDMKKEVLRESFDFYVIP